MATSELNFALRSKAGKGVSRSLRRQGLVPAIVYGKGLESCALSVSPKELKSAIATEAGWNTLITLKGDGPFDGKVVILKDLQVDAIRRDPMHVDFQVVNMSQKVHVMVPVHPVGKSAGEKIGGSLQVIRKEIEVICLPNAIPGSIEVDVTAMTIGDVLHIADIALPADVEIPHDVNFTVITCTGHKEEEVETEETEETEED
ncbi:50S ribosomal protein L25/general stress protein Ctc [Trichloromonas sp.]|uniref:50S ribosomal protein L25/general stress protein Ctc n=1 Tax=Trichloromonas sp. TaxID=3069249 RepID=UPI003D81AF72